MFHTIRQNGSSSAYVLIRLIEVLTRVAEVEPAPGRRAALERHADLTIAAARETITDRVGKADCEASHRTFGTTLDGQVVGCALVGTEW